jgi:hypothetical protein
MNTATINPGGSASYSIAIGPVIPATALPGPITLSAFGGPAGATYTFSPASVPGNAGLTTATLTVAMPSSVLAVNPTRLGNLRISSAIAELLLPFVFVRRHSGGRTGGVARTLLLIVISVICFTTLNGCGGATSSGDNSTQPQSYTVTVTGTAGALTHSTAVTLIVN